MIAFAPVASLVLYHINSTNHKVKPISFRKYIFTAMNISVDLPNVVPTFKRKITVRDERDTRVNKWREWRTIDTLTAYFNF